MKSEKKIIEVSISRKVTFSRKIIYIECAKNRDLCKSKDNLKITNMRNINDHKCLKQAYN